MKTINSFGIIGAEGKFGKFLGDLVSEKCDVKVNKYDLGDKYSEEDLFETLQSDFVVLAIPIPYILDFIETNKQNIGAETILVNISSIQKYIYDNITSKFPDLRVLFMHPMFGPQTYNKSDNKLKIIHCGHQNILDSNVEDFKNFLQNNFDVNVLSQTADEHDYEEANSQFLTMLISMICKKANFLDINIENGTVAYEKLIEIMNIYKEDYSLTHDIYKYNPYCKEVIENIKLGINKSEKSLLQG